MSSWTTRLWAGALLGLAALAFSSPLAWGQGLTPGQARLIQRNEMLAAKTGLNPFAAEAAAVARYNAALLATTGYNPLFNPYAAGVGAYAGGFPAYPATVAPTMGAVAGGSALSTFPDPYGGGSAMSTAPGLGGAGGAAPYSYPPGGSGYYSPYSYEDPIAGFLRGSAAVINAQGQFQIQRAQGRILTEQWKQAQQDTRRRIHEEWLWERANTPTLQDILEQEQAQRERNAIRTPAITDVWNGTTLNTLLGVAQKKPSSGAPNIPLAEEVVKRLNIVPGKSNYSLAAVKQLKDGVPLNWPLELTTSQYQSNVAVINKLLPEAVNSAYSTGKVEPRDLLEMRAALGKLYAALDANATDLGPSQYIPAKRFLNQLDEALKALQQDNVDRFFNKLGNVRSVADLVREMSTKGLTFGPAGSGDEAAYLAVQQALAAYDSAVSQGNEK